MKQVHNNHREVTNLLFRTINDTQQKQITPVFQIRQEISRPAKPLISLAGDLNHDCYVTLEDLALFAESWMLCGNPFDDRCGVDPP